jgi:uncharacterized membrane protein YdbT with pleckstrin-like domain
VVENAFQTHPWWVWPTWGAIALFFLLTTQLASWRRVVTTEYVITDETAYARTGHLLLRLESVPMDKLTDITVHTSLLGRLMGYSNLMIRTAGGAILFVGLADAYRLRESVQDQRRDFIRRLLEEAGRGREADRVAEGGAPIAKGARCRCPACEHAFDGPPERPVDVTCPRCGLEGTLFAPEVTAA